MVQSFRTNPWLRHVVALILSLALTAQVALAGVPAPPSVLDDGRIEVELCIGGGMRLVLFDPQTGTYEDISDDGDVQPHCPYCVLGAALDAAIAPDFPARKAVLVKTRFALETLTLPADAQIALLHPIRGPPALRI